MNAWWIDILLPGFVVLFGYLVLGVAGFGSALIIVPALAWHWPLSFVVPLILLMEIPSIFLHTGLNYRQVAWRELPPLLPSVIVGAAAGYALLRLGNANWLLIGLGLYIVFVAARGLRHSQAAARRQDGSQGRSLAGFLMGLVETMFATSGPIVLLWLLRRIPDPYQLRATMPATLLFLSVVALASAAVSGVLHDAQLWKRLAVLLPFALTGIVAGNYLARRLQAGRLQPLIYGLLLLSGIALAVGAIARMLGLDH